MYIPCISEIWAYLWRPFEPPEARDDFELAEHIDKKTMGIIAAFEINLYENGWMYARGSPVLKKQGHYYVRVSTNEDPLNGFEIFKVT